MVADVAVVVVWVEREVDVSVTVDVTVVLVMVVVVVLVVGTLVGAATGASVGSEEGEAVVAVVVAVVVGVVGWQHELSQREYSARKLLAIKASVACGSSARVCSTRGDGDTSPVKLAR